MQARHPIRFSSQMERVRCKPWGLYGGLSGLGNSVALHRFGQTEETHFPNGKALNQVLQPGDAYILRSGGGGGYGSPLERDLDSARARRALRLCHEGGRGELLRRGVQGRHARARSWPRPKRAAPQMQQQGLPHDEPITEIIIPFPTARAAAGAMPEHEKMTEEERVAFAMQCRCCR